MHRRDQRPGLTEHRAQFRTKHIRMDETEAGGPIKFAGHAAVFNSRTWIGSWFEEQVAPGAFSDSIEADDIRMLINHDTNLLLARNGAGNLRLSEDDDGLAVEADIVPTQYARDLSMLLEVPDGAERATIDQMSFAFEILGEERSTVEDDDGRSHDLYTITEARLWEVSVVTFPAYSDTDAGLRAAGELLEGREDIEAAERALVLRSAYRGQPYKISEPAPAGQETPESDIPARTDTSALALATRMKGMTL